jgi:hypothetical protein
MQKLYTVTWTIDIEADTVEEAALEAREYQLDSESIANVFTIKDKESGKTELVDLEELESS